MTDETTEPKDEYKPTFGSVTRTVIYVVCGILGFLGALTTITAAITGAPSWLIIGSSVCAFAAPYFANMFGVAYNPMKMDAK